MTFGPSYPQVQSAKCSLCEKTMSPRWYTVNDDNPAKLYVLLCKRCDLQELMPK